MIGLPPDEVAHDAALRFGETIDPARLVWEPKQPPSGGRGSAWAATRISGKHPEKSRGWERCLKIDGRSDPNPWRKCHTKNYWAWYLKYPLPEILDLLAETP